MFGGNAFGALGVEEPTSSPGAGPSSRQIDGEEVDAEWLRLRKTNQDVTVRVSEKVELDGLPQECNLLAISNQWDLLIAGGDSDVRIHRLSEVHKLLEESARDAAPISTPLRTLPLPARPIWIRLAHNEEKLVVATADGAGICLYNLREILSGDTSPYHTLTTGIPNHLINVLPNPAKPSSTDSLARYVALVSSDGFQIADIEGRNISGPTAGPATCACWSAKGKQIVVGNPSGTLVQYTPEGNPKAQIPPPPELDPDQQFYPTFVQWLENDVFLVCYASATGTSEDPLEVFIIQRQKTAFTYIRFFDPLDTMGVPGRSGTYRHFAGLRGWTPSSRHLGFILSGLATEIGVLHAGEEEGGGSRWEILMLDETARGVMPAAKGASDDTSALGLELDLTSKTPIRRGISGGEEQPDLPPPPRVLAYSQEGFVVSFNIEYDGVEGYPAMVEPQDLATASGGGTSDQMDASSTPTPAPVSEPPKPSAFSGFGGTSGASAFGSSSSASAFGATSTPAKPAGFGASAFGQSTTPVPSPAFGTGSKPAAFGASAFGASNTGTTAPKPGGFGQSAFGQSSTPSAFGKTSTPSAFGQTNTPTPSAFGQSSTPSAFGHSATPSAFGQSSKPTAGSAFGTASPAVSPWGQPTKPATPSTPTVNPFAATASAGAFSQSSFGQHSKPADAKPAPANPFAVSTSGSAFGQSAFGQSSKPTTASTPSAPVSAFGQTSSPASTSLGFGAFGKPATGFSFGGANTKFEDKKEKPASPFGSGASAVSAFGSGTAFGTTSFGSGSAFATKPQPSPSIKKAEDEKTAKSPFSGFGSTSSTPLSQSVTPSPSAESAKAAQDDFGLGGFASALDVGQTQQTGGVPGLEDSPPQSPIGQASKIPAGLEDSPPPSPPLLPKSTPTVTQKSSASTGSSFIKPATAFSGTTSGGFGAFGQNSKTATMNAFGANPIPAAFASSPSTPATATGSAFGQTSKPASTAFGQSSKPTSTPAFGASTAFASTKPLGFGSAASTPTARGSISGGFGGFAAKPPSNDSGSSEAKPAKGFAGFGGFAATGTNVFGSKAPGSESTKSSDSGIFGQKGVSAFGSADVGKNVFGISKDQPKKEDTPASTTPPPTTPPSISPTVAPSVSTGEAGKPVKEEHRSASPEGYHVPTSDPTPATDKETADEESGIEPAPFPPGYDKTTSPTSDVKQTEQDNTTAVDVPLPSPRHEHIETSTTPTGSSEDGSNDDGVLVQRPTDDVEEKAPIAEVSKTSPKPLEEKSVEAEEEDEYEEDYEDEDEDDYEDEEEGPSVDEEYDEEDQEDDEDADDDGENEQRHRRRSSSIAPEMSPIQEEASEIESEEDEDPEGYDVSPAESTSPKATKTPKSPPLWFGKEATSETSTPPPDQPLFPTSVETQATPSPPAPSFVPIAAAQKLPPAFNFKHAARTSSPLSQHPPQTGDTDTPPGSPSGPAQEAKPATSGFNFFGSQPTAGEQPKSIFGSQPASAAKPTGLGLGRPPTAPGAQSPFSFFNQTAKPTSPFEPVAQVSTPQPRTPTTPAPPVVPKSTDPATMIQRQPAPQSPHKPTDGQRTMSSLLERMIDDLLVDIDNVKSILQTNAEYHQRFDESYFVKARGGNSGLESIKALPFAPTQDLELVLNDLTSQIEKIKLQGEEAESKLADVQNKMLKSDMKSGQADKLYRARTDPAFAKSLESPELSPSQAQTRSHLQEMIKAMETGISQYEASIAGLKKRLEKKSEVSDAEETAKLEQVKKDARNVELGIQDTAATVDDLIERIRDIQLKGPKLKSKPGQSPASTSPAVAAIPKTQEEIEADKAVAAVKARQAKLKERLAQVTKTNMTTGTTGPAGRGHLLAHTALIGGPVSMESMPMPGHVAIQIKAPKVEVKEEPEPISSFGNPTAVPAGPATPSPSGFGGFGNVKIQLDPSVFNVTPAPASTSSSRSRGVVSSHRQHSPAARYAGPSASSPGAEGSGAGSPVASVVFTPPPSTAAVKKNSPSGFFSLSDYVPK